MAGKYSLKRFLKKKNKKINKNKIKILVQRITKINKKTKWRHYVAMAIPIAIKPRS